MFGNVVFEKGFKRVFTKPLTVESDTRITIVGVHVYDNNNNDDD